MVVSRSQICRPPVFHQQEWTEPTRNHLTAMWQVTRIANHHQINFTSVFRQQELTEPTRNHVTAVWQVTPSARVWVTYYIPWSGLSNNAHILVNFCYNCRQKWCRDKIWSFWNSLEHVCLLKWLCTVICISFILWNKLLCCEQKFYKKGKI
jgi:hypothetical protein